MPPKRRSQASRTASSQQSTLSFHGKPSRVTKASSAQNFQSKDTKKDPALFEDVARSDVKAEGAPDLAEPTTAEKAIEQQTQQESERVSHPLQPDAASTRTEDVLGGRAQESDVGAVGGKGAGWVADEEDRARKVSETQIKRYWREKESQRLAPRVHQEGLTVHEKVLREWDMSGQYGPCIGIARLKRWKRANTLGLNPPLEVLAVLLKELDGGDSKLKSQRAYVDELMSSRFVET